MKTPNFPFIPKAKVWGIVSAVLLGLCLVVFLTRGVDLSMDFVGGVSYTLEDVRDDVTPAELREAAEGAGAQDVTAQIQMRDDVAFGAVVRTESMDPGSPESLAVRDALIEVSDAQDSSTSFVGPTWGQRITQQALVALVVFLIVIAIYISLRLELKMAIAAIASVIHDVLLTLGVYALVGFSVSPATLIAVLTILGYSLYDTIVVFDRVKNNETTLGEPGRRTYAEMINTSLNQVLYRSLSTSITSLLPVGALLFIGAQLLGASTLQDLALALFVGMAAGVYSSLFVAGPMLAWLKSREPEEIRRVEKVTKADQARAATADGPVADAAVTDPTSRAPITTEYVRGQGRSPKRRGKGGRR